MTPSTSPRFDHSEGAVARSIEEQTAKICKVDKRTIRYRLAAADKQLKTMKEDL